MSFAKYAGEAVGVAGSVAKGINDYRKKNKSSTPNPQGSGVDPALTGAADPPSYKRGGKVKKGGRAKVHKGETVLTAKQSKKYAKMKRGKRGSKR